MKIVLDTNVLVSGIFWAGNPSKIVELWSVKKITLAASELMSDEYLKTVFSISKKMNQLELRDGSHPNRTSIFKS